MKEFKKCRVTGDSRFTEEETKRSAAKFGPHMSAYQCDFCHDWHLRYYPKGIPET